MLLQEQELQTMVIKKNLNQNLNRRSDIPSSFLIEIITIINT